MLEQLKGDASKLVTYDQYTPMITIVKRSLLNQQRDFHEMLGHAKECMDDFRHHHRTSELHEVFHKP